MKIALVGPYPKPYGGVSIHVKRLEERLRKRGIVVTVYANTRIPKKEDDVVVIKRTRMWLLRQFLYGRENIIHYHGYNPKLLKLFSLLTFTKGKRIIVTLHSFRSDAARLRDKLAFWLAMKARIHFITVSLKIKEKIISLSIKTKNVTVIPAFLLPIIREEEIAEIPQQVWNFINTHTPIISANAAEIVFYKGQDLYGIDMCIELCASLKMIHFHIGFVLSLPDIGDYEYFELLKRKIVEKKIEDNFLFITEQYQFYPILMRSDVLVRPTNTDGDSVSLREALYFKVPAVASDVCPRHEGIICFKTRDINDLTLKVKDVLNNYEQYRKILETVKIEDDFEKIMKVYQTVNECKDI